MRQTASPESGPSLGNPDLNLRDEHFRLEAPLDFRSVCAFKEQAEGLCQVVPRFFDRGTLAGDIILGTQC